MRKIPLAGLPIGLLLMAVLIFTALPAAVHADDVKMGAWGTVTWNDEPAGVGTKIEVFVGTEKAGEWTINNPAKIGEYGNMEVTSDEVNRDNNVPLTYKVNGIVATTEKVMQPCDLAQDPIIEEPVFGVCNQEVNLDAVSGAPQATWNFPRAGSFPRHLPDAFNGQVVLDDLDPNTDVPWQVQGIYHESGAYWAPGAPAGVIPLEYLVGGLHANYVVAVAAPCQWNIQQQ